MKDILKVFYTDDDPDDQDLFKEVIERSGISVAVYFQSNGEQLITRLNTESFPDLIFLDLNMPVKNGLETLQEIRQSEKLRHLPVIIFTTSNDHRAIESARTLGANFYITKSSHYPVFKKSIAYALSVDWTSHQAENENFIYRDN